VPHNPEATLLKTALVAIACSAVTATAFVYVGRTTYSSAFQADFPINSAIKVTPDSGNVWSWHHQFVHPSGSPTVADVLVDFNGDQVMDTVHDEIRVLVTDLQLVGEIGHIAWARVVDSGGKRLAAGIGGHQTAGAVQHISLTTPIVLPVGSFLRVEISGDGGTYEVNLIGRVVNP
jgi:hypothetical protein